MRPSKDTKLTNTAAMKLREGDMRKWFIYNFTFAALVILGVIYKVDLAYLLVIAWVALGFTVFFLALLAIHVPDDEVQRVMALAFYRRRDRTRFLIDLFYDIAICGILLIYDYVWIAAAYFLIMLMQRRIFIKVEQIFCKGDPL